jgi:hypothetical protein
MEVVEQLSVRQKQTSDEKSGQNKNTSTPCCPYLATLATSRTNMEVVASGLAVDAQKSDGKTRLLPRARARRQVRESGSLVLSTVGELSVVHLQAAFDRTE